MAHKIEHMFEKFKHQVHSIANKTHVNMEKYDDLVDKVLSINPLMELVDEIFHAHVEFYPVVVYIASAVFCLSLSAIFHSFFVINPTICKILQKCDYAGIVILIFGSSYSLFFYNFYCYDFWNHFYCYTLGIISIVCFITSLSDYMDKEEGKMFLGLMMGGLGLFNIIPVIHIAFMSMSATHGANMMSFSDISGFLWTGFFYLSGLAVYIMRFPERYYPKKFDIFFNSHSIWHIFVFLGALSHYFLILNIFRVRSGMTCIRN